MRILTVSTPSSPNRKRNPTMMMNSPDPLRSNHCQSIRELLEPYIRLLAKYRKDKVP